jgi:HK97 family phage prohead protease
MQGDAGRAAAGGHHVPGTGYDWRHGWEPLTFTAAQSHYHNRVPQHWAPPAGAPGERASGKMAYGDWHAGHQTVAPAPVGILPNETHRTVKAGGTEVHVRGSYSDPWWMAKPGGGWAVSRRWQSKAQDSYAYEGGKYQTFPVPAIDERHLTPVTSAGVPVGERPANEIGVGKTVLIGWSGTERTGSHAGDTGTVVQESGTHVLVDTGGRNGLVSVRKSEVRVAHTSGSGGTSYYRPGSGVLRAADWIVDPDSGAPRQIERVAGPVLHLADGGQLLASLVRERVPAALARAYEARAMLHEPIGKPGGPGVWHTGKQYPAYFQHIRNDLMQQGHPEGEAHSLAWGILRNFAAGHDGKGNRVSADTQAKAVAALAEMKKLQAEAKATRSTPMSDYDADGLDASWDGNHDDLPDLTGLGVPHFEAVAGHAPDLGPAARARVGTGARFAALKASLGAKGAEDPGGLAAWIGRRKFGKARFQGLAAAARKRAGAPAAAVARSELVRFYPLEDIRILTRADGEGSGRVVEAYATVFDQEAEIHDHQGHYREIIDRTAFDNVLARIYRSPGGLRQHVKVLFNHGKTMEGQPAAEFQLPLGVPLEVRAEDRGLLTRTEYDAGDPFTDRVLSKIRSGSITSQSFVGGIERSDPELRGPGDRYRGRSGVLPLVRRMRLGLREYGPVLFASYSGAEILGVRMTIPGYLDNEGEPGFDPYGEFGPDDEGLGTGGIPEAMPPRRDHAHRLYQLTTEQKLDAAGITLPGRGEELWQPSRS